jgi:hypothetical protein
LIKAADMLIARRADTKARADFATWKMIAKLNGASSLPAEAQAFLVSQGASQPDDGARGDQRPSAHYRSYYGMGGSVPPDVKDRTVRYGQRYGLQAPANPAAQDQQRVGRQTSASGCPDICLPHHRLYRVSIFPALM